MFKSAVASHSRSKGERGGRQVGQKARAQNFFIVFVVIGAVVAAPLALGGVFLQIANLGAIMSIAAMALTVLIGPAGLLSLGHGAFLAIGAFTAAVLATKLGFSFPLALVCAGLVGMVIGGLIALVTLRTFGIYLSIATLALQYVVELILTDVEVKMTRAVGFFMPPASIFGFEIVGPDKWWLANLAMVFSTYGLLRWILSGHLRRAWILGREKETVAASLGVSIVGSRIAAFMFTAFIASVAGGLFGYYTGTVQIASFPFQLSVTYVTIVAVGGLGSLGGAIIGTYVIVILPTALEWLLARMGLDALSGSAGLESVALGVILALALLKVPSRLQARLLTSGREVR